MAAATLNVAVTVLGTQDIHPCACRTNRGQAHRQAGKLVGRAVGSGVGNEWMDARTVVSGWMGGESVKRVDGWMQRQTSG